MKHIYILGIILTFAASTGCNRYQAEDILLPRNEVSLTIKGVDQIKFDEESWQLGYSSEINEFRIVNDRLNNWVILRCNATPSTVGQSVTAYLEYTTSNDTKKLNGLTFTVEKTSPDGHIWLWNSDKKIGIVIKSL